MTDKLCSFQNLTLIMLASVADQVCGGEKKLLYLKLSSFHYLHHLHHYVCHYHISYFSLLAGFKLFLWNAP